MIPAPMPVPILIDDDVVVAGGDARPPLAEGEDVDVVVDPDRRAVALGEPLADRIAVPAGHDRWRDRPPGPELDRAGDADPDPPQPARDVMGRPEQRRRTARRPGRGRRPVRPRSGPARRGGPRIRPSRVVSATSMLVAPRSATRTWPASARNASWRGGRPPVDGPTSPSTTRPRSMSSPTRWATIARPRPVRSTSSERDRDRPSRISSSTATSASRASSGSGDRAFAWSASAGPRSSGSVVSVTVGMIRRHLPLAHRLLLLTCRSMIGPVRPSFASRPSGSARLGADRASI